MKKIIYTQRVEVISSYNERRDCADQRIAEFISACGYLPIPVMNNIELIAKIVDEIKPDGIILVGGNSLVKYGGNAPERDEVDEYLIEIAIKNNIPLYGFCRGMQSILDHFGNSLTKVTGHVAVRHRIIGDEGGLIVNSFHNEACIKLNNNELVAVMRSDDGVVEMVRHKNLKIMGTMWHPEREEPFNIHDIERVMNFYGK